MPSSSLSLGRAARPADQPAAQVPARKEQARADQLSGPILAGGRLVLVGSNGTLINFDPATGNFQSQTSVGVAITQAPVVANSTLYVLDDDGRLHAFR